MNDPGAAWQQWVPTVISVIALLVSVGSFAWGVLKHFHYDGGRVLVTIRPAIWQPGFSIARMTSPTGAWRSGREPEGRVPPRGVECAELVVENAGRTAVTVCGVGFAYKGRRRPVYARKHRVPGLLRRRVRHSVSPRLFSHAGEGNDQYRRDHQPFRLEPYDRAVFVLDVHSVVEIARQDRPKGRRTVLRGFADIAGTSAPTLSPWRRRWRIPRGAVTFVDFAEVVPAEVPIALILARNTNPGEAHVSSLEYAARLIAAGLWVHRDVPDTRERVSRSFEYADEIERACGPAAAMAQYYVRELLTEHGGQLTWEGARLQHRLEKKAVASRGAGVTGNPDPDGTESGANARGTHDTQEPTGH